MRISVHKFGGVVLGIEAGFRNLCHHITNSREKSVVIISAIGNTSSLLNRAILLTEDNNYLEAKSILDKVFNFHKEISKKILSENNYSEFLNCLNSIILAADNILKSVIITQELTGRTYDKFLSLGEDLAIALLKQYFINSENVTFIDSREIIITDNNFKSANPIIEKSFTKIHQHLLPLFNNYSTVILQGYIGGTEEGITTTMGFESSNLSATIIADSLDVKTLTIWSNVDGIYNADPNEFSDALLLKNISYKSALKAGISGLKLLYPEMLRIARSKNITLIFRNGIYISDNFTVINETKEENPLFIIKQFIEINEFDDISNINTSNLKFLANHFDSYYLVKLVKNKEIQHYSYQMTIINSFKSNILKIFTDNFSKEINDNNLIILSGFEETILSCIIIEDINIYNKLCSLILKL